MSEGAAVVSKIRPRDGIERLCWECDGCGEVHMIPIAGERSWSWNGSAVSPTISPSILVRFTRADTPVVCHSFVVNGSVQFLSDSTHALAGQTVPMVPERADPFADDPLDAKWLGSPEE